MKETFEMIVKALVSDPEAVDVREAEGGRGTLIEVRVAPGDMGKVIGRQGKTVRALRALAAAAGEKRGRRYGLEIIE